MVVIHSLWACDDRVPCRSCGFYAAEICHCRSSFFNVGLLIGLAPVGIATRHQLFIKEDIDLFLEMFSVPDGIYFLWEFVPDVGGTQQENS